MPTLLGNIVFVSLHGGYFHDRQSAVGDGLEVLRLSRTHDDDIASFEQLTAKPDLACNDDRQLRRRLVQVRGLPVAG